MRTVINPIVLQIFTDVFPEETHFMGPNATIVPNYVEREFAYEEREEDRYKLERKLIELLSSLPTSEPSDGDVFPTSMLEKDGLSRAKGEIRSQIN